MSQCSKSLDEVFTLSKLLQCEEINLSAWSNTGNHELLVLYTESGNFICYYFTENEPIIKHIPWFADPIHAPVSIDFSPSGFFLLILSKSFHLYILPILSVIDSSAKTHLCLDTNDLTIHTYPFLVKVVKTKSKSKSPNSSLSLISSLSIQSSSSSSITNDKQRSSISSSSSLSDSQGNDNVTKLRESLVTKCEVYPSTVCWWQSFHNSLDVAVIGTKSGDILFVDLITGSKIGETFVKGEIKSLSICQDKSGENLFLLITVQNNDQYKLILEQQSLGYLWSGKQNLNGNEDGDSLDGPNSGNGNYLPSARARLQGLKQMSAEKLASLKHKIAETRSKMGTKQGLSEDNPCKPGGLAPENLNSVIGDTLISPQCYHDVNVLVGYYAQTQLLTVHSMNLDLAPMSIHKLPFETEEVLLGDHLIFVQSNNKTVLQVISSKLTESFLEKSSDFNVDSVLGKWDFKLCETSNEENSSKEEKTSLAKPDLIPQEQTDDSSEKILNVYKKLGRGVEDWDILKAYNLDKTKEELPELPNIENCVVVTNKGVYLVESNTNVVKMALELILETQELEKAERLCTIFGINLQKLLELAGDIKLAALEFSTAIALYKLSKCGLLKSIIKLACGNHCSQVLTYSTMLMANSVSDMSLTERIHLSNLMLMAYTQQILKCENNRHLMEKFIDFLQKNLYFDEILAVSVTGQSLLFPCLHKLITYKGLILDGYNVLIKLMDRFMHSKVLEWSLNKNDFWKCATETSLVEAMVIKSASFPVYADYVSLHLEELEPEYLNKLLKVLDPTSPTLRPVARSFKKENSFDNDDTQMVFPFGKLIELFLLTLMIKLHKMQSGNEDYNRELILPSPESVDKDESSLLLSEESFGNGDALGEEIWPIRKDIQGNVDKFKKRLDTTLSCGYGHTALIRNGCVYTWGQTTKGCLGLGPTMTRYAAPSPVTWLTGLKVEVSVISCGKFHTAALTNNGVYTWGCSRFGQLGLGELHESPHPRLVTCLAHENVVDVKCGQFHTLALTNQGSVFAWGWGVHGQLGLGCIDNQRRPKYLSTLKEHFIVEIAAGHGHSLVLSDKGHVYSFGSSVFGQLGTGNNAKSSAPVLVKGINGRVVLIATGYFHNLAVTEMGTMYTWGSSPQCLRFQAQARKRSRLLHNQNGAANSEGETKPEESSEQTPEGAGLLDKTESEMHLSPSIVDTSNITGKISQISCGCHHSALVTDSGGLYTWGRSIDGQLGNGGHREVSIPTQINENGTKADRVSCGCEFTMAEEKHTGKVFAWGSNSVGQLAIPIKESATKSLDGKLVLLKSCKRIVRLLDRGAGSNSIVAPREIPEIPSPSFTYQTLTNCVASPSGRLSHLDPNYSERSLHFVIEKFTNSINLPLIFRKSLELGNFQVASKICLLQNRCKQSVVYQLKALQNLSKYHVKSGSYLEKQEEMKSSQETEIHLFTVEGGHEDLYDESRSRTMSNDERCEETTTESSVVADDKLTRLKSAYMDHAKHILEVYLNLNSSQTYEDFDNCFILETGIQFWTAEKLPMDSLESFLRGKLDDIYYDFGYLLFCTQQKDEQVSVLEQFSSGFLLELTSKILDRVEKNESCVEYLETMSRILTNDEEKFGRRKRPIKRKKSKSETFLEEIRDNLEHQRICENFIKISYGDVIGENVYFFSCGHHHSLKSLEEDCKVFQEITDETMASKLMSFYSLLESERKGDLACPSCVRDYLRQ